jgi:hypothetical protein
MAAGGDAAGDQHRRQARSAEALVAQRNAPLAGMAQGKIQRQRAPLRAGASDAWPMADGRKHGETRCDVIGGSDGETHGGVLVGRAIESRGSPERSCSPPGEGADHNHLPVDAQVPAGFGTAMERTCMQAAPSSCPGVFGPVPQPVSMDGHSLPVVPGHVNRFIRIKRLIYS